MKKIRLLVAPLLALSFLTNCSKSNSWQLSNQDGSLLINVSLSNEGTLTYSVEKNHKSVVNNSVLGMAFTSNINGENKKYDFSKGLTYVGEKNNDKQFSYDCYSGKVSKVSTSYKEMIITTKVDDLLMDVTFRALNDGYGFQYSFRKENGGQETLTWDNEYTEFNIPTDSLTYGMDYIPYIIKGKKYYAYEDFYGIRSFEDIDLSDQVSMPFAYEANGYYSFITESELIGSGYHGSFLQKNDEKVLATVEAPAYGSKPDRTVTLPFTSPWRVSCVGSYATAFETTIVEDIQGEVEEYIPEGEEDFDYSWVEPGISAWNWDLNRGVEHQGDFDLQKKYIDLAKDMGWKYTIFDDGWEAIDEKHEKDRTVKDLIEYAHSTQGGTKPAVKVILWAHTMKKFLNKAQMVDTLEEYQALGADGLKVDFWSGEWDDRDLEHQMEDKQTIQQYEDFYQLTAKYKMVVNCHGSNKPTGERRKYPHVLNREAIRGNEIDTVFAGQSAINTILRGTVGPTDFTPLVYPKERDVTIGYQMALTILYEAGTPSMADLAETYLDTSKPYNEYYKRLPATWDKSKFIAGNPQTYMVVARKKGDNWWVAGITTSQQRTINIDFSFLDNGDYTANFYVDGDRGRPEDYPEDYEYKQIEKTTKTISSSSKEKIKVLDNSGFVVELIKK